MARYLRIRHVVKTDRASAREQIQAICGNKPDGSHWSLTQDEAIAQVEDGISLFYVESAGGRRFDVIVAMDLHAANTSRPSRMTNFCICQAVTTSRTVDLWRQGVENGKIRNAKLWGFGCRGLYVCAMLRGTELGQLKCKEK